MSQYFISMEELEQVSLEAITYDQFYRQRGVLKIGMLTMPRVNETSTFELPRSSIVHYLPQSDTEYGPNPTNFLLRKSVTKLFSENVRELSHHEGSPMRNALSVDTLADKYARQYRQIRRLRNINTALRDDKSVVIVNYAMVPHLYKYRATWQTPLNRFQNHLLTMVSEANRIAALSPLHQQFVEMSLPRTILEKPQFVAGSREMTKDRLKTFSDTSALFLLELWKWLGEGRETSLFSRLTPEAMKALNIVFTVKGKYTVLSLAKLNEWRKDPGDKKDTGYSPAQMQLSFFMFLECLYAIKTVTPKSIVVTPTPGTTDDSDKPVAIISEGDAVVEMAKLEEESKSIAAAIPDDVQEAYSPVSEQQDLIEPPEEDTSPEQTEGVTDRVMKLASDGLLSSAEQQRFDRLSQSYKTIPNPHGEGTLADLIVITQEEEAITPYQIEDIGLVTDKSLLQTSLKEFGGQYLSRGLLQKDIARMVVSAQNAGVIVTDYRVEKVVDAMNRYETHIVELTPVGGKKSTWRFKIPTIDKHGVFLSGGVKYRMRTQRGDIPIRKTKPHEVALTSYHSKLFIRRSLKKVDDYGTWLGNQVQIAIAEGKKVKSVVYDNCFDPKLKSPRPFSALSTRYKRLTMATADVIFDSKLLMVELGMADKDFRKLRESYLKNGEIVCGKTETGFLIMAAAGHLYDSATGNVFGTVEELLDIESQKAPVECVDLDVMGKEIPIGMILGQRYGLSNLLRKLNVQHRFVTRGSRLQLTPREYVIRFKDQSLVLDRDQRNASLLFSSLNSYHRILEEFEYAEFDKPDVYGAVYIKAGLGVRYATAVDNLFKMYVDPITRDYLKQMGEPVRFGPLLFRCIDLLATDNHPRQVDGSMLRFRGYERIAGRVYKSLVGGINQYNNRPISAKASVDINPYDVWASIDGDPAISIIEESNPLHNIKELANVTYAGTDGRSSRTMVRKAREFDVDDPGQISEATVDNGDVAVTVFKPANPQLASVRGNALDYERSKEFFKSKPNALLSMTALVSPAITHDDPKRANFASIQHSHVRAVDGYQIFPYLTGAEAVVAHYGVSDLFSSAAEGKGRVTELSETHIKVEYDDPKLKPTVVELGRRYGKAAGDTIPHDIVTDLKIGDKVTKDFVIAWNKGFFSRLVTEPTQVIWKTGVISYIALLESPGTFEDSCELSASLNVKMTMNTTAPPRELDVRSDQTIHRLVKVGDVVEADSILCNIEDPVTAGADLFSEQSVATLNAVARNSPRAKSDGTIGKIEVFYNVDLDDEDGVSPSLRELIVAADKLRAKRVKQLQNGEATTGFVPEDLEAGSVKVVIYIDRRLPAGDADKFVFGNQAKSVSRREMYGVNQTEDGRDIDGFFSWTSVDNRQIDSPQIMGTTAQLVILANQRAAKAYRDNGGK